MITEAEFQRQVIQLAHLLGWTVYSVPDSRRVSATGFPDLVGMRGESLWVAELKRVGKKPRPEQKLWLAAFAAAGIPAFCWTPKDMAIIREVLT